MPLPSTDAAAVRAGLAGPLCRCTGFDGIVPAVSRVAQAGRP
jgi:aerobic-type carbon monoxide dehydrogenase small subunit (CoxS/CutS family)